MKRLRRSNSNIKIFGVCGGIGEFLNIDPTIIRLIWILMSFSGVPILLYFVAALVIPKNPHFGKYTIHNENNRWYDGYL